MVMSRFQLMCDVHTKRLSERYPIPNVEELLHKLNRRAVLSKVDLKWGFHQILFSECSQHITTLVTHHGMCQYKRLMYDMTSAPGKYQQIVRDVLEGCEGVANTADDLIIHGNGVEELDRRLFAVLDSLKRVGLMLIVASVNSAYQGLPFLGTN